MMKALTTSNGVVMDVTFHRLIRWGATDTQAHALSRVIVLSKTATDDEVERAVILALVDAKHAVDGVACIEYLGGQRRDTLRLEGR